MTNEMRKLMETVADLYEHGQVGFKNVRVGVDADDVKLGGEPHTVQTIYVYDSDWDFDNPRQQHFTRQSGVSEEEYAAILKDVLWQVKQAIEQAYTEKSLWDDGKEYRYEYFALGADVDKSIDDRLISDIIKELDLSDTPSTRSDGGDYIVFNIDRPEKKKWWPF